MCLKIPRDVVEALMGHEAYLTEAYRRYDEKQLAEMYKDGIENLAVFETPGDVSDIREQLAQKDKEIRELKSDMQRLMIKVLTMEDQQKTKA